MNLFEQIVLPLAVVVIVVLAIDANRDYLTQHQVRPVYVEKLTTRDAFDLTPTSEEADLETIGITHTGVNAKWEPEWDFSDGKGIPLHVMEVETEVIEQICGDAWACTINMAESPPRIRVWLNAGVENDSPYYVEPNACLMVVPKRPESYPRFWFFIVGHELMHCVHGNFHPEDILHATNPRP